MHFMIQTFKIIIFAILFSNIITKQNENTTTKNNTHTMKESDDDEYVDIKNKEFDNNIKRNEFDEFKDYVLKNTDVLIALIISVLAVCVCMLVLVIMNCSRWENISECNRQCIKRNYLIFRNCCRGDPKQPSYHPEHSCEDFCRWCCTYDYFDFHKSIPNPHQSKRAERSERAERAQCAECAQRVKRAEVVAEPSVAYDGSNVSIQEHLASFRRFNPNPHQPERAERAQCIERAQVHAKAEPSVIYDGSNVSIQEHLASFRRFNPNPHQPERAERAQCIERAQRVERAQVHAEAEPSIIYDRSNVSIQEHLASFRRFNPNPHQPERAERAQCIERAQRVERAQVHAEAEPSIIYDRSNVSIQERHANLRKSNPNPDHQPERAERAQFAERAQSVERAQVHAEAEPSIIYDRSNVSIQERHANFRKSNPNPDHQPERAERAERAQFAERAQRVERAQVHAEAEPSIIYDRSNVSIQEHLASFRRFNPNPHQPERAERAQCIERAQRVERAQVHAEAEPSIIYDRSNVSIQEHLASFRRFNPNPHQLERAERAQCIERAQRVERAQVHAEAEPSIIYDRSNVSIQERHANLRKSNPNPDHQPERAERAQFAERAQSVERAQVHAEAEPSIICDWSSVSITKSVFMETDF